MGSALVNLKLPWHVATEPRGPTEVRDCEGQSVAEFDQEYTARWVVALFNTFHDFDQARRRS